MKIISREIMQKKKVKKIMRRSSGLKNTNTERRPETIKVCYKTKISLSLSRWGYPADTRTAQCWGCTVFCPGGLHWGYSCRACTPPWGLPRSWPRTGRTGGLRSPACSHTGQCRGCTPPWWSLNRTGWLRGIISILVCDSHPRDHRRRTHSLRH